VFTGIVRERGRIRERAGGAEGLRLVVEAGGTARDAAVGDSVSIAGVCLTAVAVEPETGSIAFDAVPETVARTSLARLAVGDEVNVEPALRAGEPLGGHFVQGHVDAVGTVRAVEREGDGARVWIEAPESVLRYCVAKGSIAAEGVSLTIAELTSEAFAVALVPHTLRSTTFGALRPGDPVNLEADMLAKYVERLAAARQGATI
jgi:riboflavin synthase alpha subunit